MALVIEDGTGVEGATSYVTLAEARAYALARALTLPSDDAALQALIVRATDYLESLRRNYQGAKVNGAGYLQWPRSAVRIDGSDEDFPSNTIPEELKKAQCQLAVDLQTVDPQATTSGPAVRQKTIGPITTIWAVGDNAGQAAPSLPKVEALLAPLLRAVGRVTVVRA